ncbi:interferon lambda-3-like [Hyla sarda]|uniref:interferon lambda-3-like n=1 Tax=Hyla sarda TaxID=327740 RepID=UPI0024C213D6|nr:interferon lambda-3-like [Hyla sarda]XP_056395710.1 interferon lambda-3-like [Hyla sarda]
MDIRLVVFSILLVAVTGHPHRRRCPMSRYKSVSSTDITGIRQLQNEHEKNMSTSAIKCYRRMMRHKPSVCDLKPSDRLILTLERVTVTTEVLANLSTSAVPDPVSQSYMMFLRIRDDLLICRELSGHSKTPSEELKPWLHHLQHFVEEASAQCLQDAVLLGLIQLLVEDVGCWAHGK